MVELAAEDDIRLLLEKSANWGWPLAAITAFILWTISIGLLFTIIDLHPYIAILLGALGIAAGYTVATRSLALRSERVTVTENEAIVEKGGTVKNYTLGPATRVHLDTEMRNLGEKSGPLKEISFENKRDGKALITTKNGWSRAQVGQPFKVLRPLIESREIVMSIGFKRYLALIEG